MIPRKKKICKSCGLSKYIWAHGNCKECDGIHNRKPIPKFSEKRKIENPKYTIERLRFLAQPENFRCFIDGCNSRADTIEHIMGRKGYADQWARDNKITLYLDVRYWRPCCNFHNLELERNSELSEKYQISKISGKQKIIKTNNEKN